MGMLYQMNIKRGDLRNTATYVEVEEEDNAEFYRQLEIDILARTMWGEARCQGYDGMRAVGHTILNRVAIAQQHDSYWWGNNIVQVAQKPYQYSTWNRSDPNFRKIQEVDDSDWEFNLALHIAAGLVRDIYEDTTEGATHYHPMGVTPYWAKNEFPVTTIEDHFFYKLVD